MRRLFKNRLAPVSIAASIALVLVGVSSAGAQSATDDPALVAAGQTVYESSCAGCHGIDGTGSSAGRPLTDVASQQADRAVHFASVKDGKGSMPAFGGQLSDDEIDSAVAYVRLTFVTAQAEPELAVTGASTNTLALAGVVLIAGGAVAVRRSRNLAASPF